MLRLTPTAVRTWADELGITDSLLAELDFRLVYILDVISKDTTFKDKLYLKGGTAINKLYLKDLSRLSVDIDFNHIGLKHGVLSERNYVIKRLMETVHSHDHAYVVKMRKKRYEQTTIHVKYPSLANVPDQHIKIEISHIERFPILPVVNKQLRLPRGEETWLMTYRPEELIATKIRALHDRRKGRDVYDLWTVSRALDLDKTAIRKLFLYYFYRGRKVFNPKLFFLGLEEAAKENAFDDDVSNFIRPDIEFDLPEETNKVLKWLSFLDELDEVDRNFIMLTRVLLRKGEIPKKKRKEITSIKYPLNRLFGEHYEITEQARRTTTSDITPFFKKKR